MVSIQIYINSLPVNTTSIDISNRRLKIMPDLSRFINLKKIYCCNNQLTSLGTLNEKLEILYCSDNQLSYLPELNERLKVLYCSYNILRILPKLNKNLEVLHCFRNQLTFLPPLNKNLKMLWCFGNKLISLPILNKNLIIVLCSNNKLKSLPILNEKLEEIICFDNPFHILECDDNIDIMRKKINILTKFRFLYYCLKFKSHFRNILWERIRKPKIEAKFNPSNLHLLLNKGCDFEEVLDKWGHDNEIY